MQFAGVCPWIREPPTILQGTDKYDRWQLHTMHNVSPPVQLVIAKRGLAIDPVHNTALYCNGHLHGASPPTVAIRLPHGAWTGAASGPTPLGQLLARPFPKAPRCLLCRPADPTGSAHLQPRIRRLVVPFGSQLVLRPEGHACRRQLPVEPLLVLQARAVPRCICSAAGGVMLSRWAA
jgi:hypothetical protein